MRRKSLEPLQAQRDPSPDTPCSQDPPSLSPTLLDGGGAACTGRPFPNVSFPPPKREGLASRAGSARPQSRVHPGKCASRENARLASQRLRGPLASACAPRPGNAGRSWERAAPGAPLASTRPEARAPVLPAGMGGPRTHLPRPARSPRAPVLPAAMRWGASHPPRPPPRRPPAGTPLPPLPRRPGPRSPPLIG